MRLDISFSNGIHGDISLQAKTLNRIDITPPTDAETLTATTAIPLVDIHNLWHTNAGSPGPIGHLPWRLTLTSGAQLNFPFVALFNHGGRLRAAVATTNLIDDTQIQLAINQEACTYEITWRIALTPQTSPFQLWLDFRDLEWQDALADWRGSLSLPPLTYPAAAWDPVFCTWYVTHAAVTQAIVESQCIAAKELGFTTLIVDDGWCYDDMKRVSPQTLPTWYAPIGDWRLSTKKFPDFRSHVSRMQELGMKYMLWVAPFLLGTDSKALADYGDAAISPAHEGMLRLDLRKADTTVLLAKLRALAKNYGLDGLKVDFLDTVPPDVSAPNSRVTEAFIRDLSHGLKEDNPNALIEFRQSYATPAMLAYGTQFRAGDAPFDWLLNFSRLAEIRLAIGSLAPVHADPAYWAPEEELRNVARHMIAMLVGIPMISMDLQQLSEGVRRCVRFYVDFYNAHRQLLNHGKWRFLFGQSSVDAAFVEAEGQRCAILAAPSRLTELLALPSMRQNWLLNLTDETLQVPDAQTYREDGSKGVDGEIVSGGMGCYGIYFVSH